MRTILSAAIAAAILTAAGGASAATTTTTFAVTATVQKTCSVSANALAFGNYTPGAGALTGNTALSVKCTKTTPFTVALNGGTTTAGTVAQRLMAAATGTDTLQYNLYTTAALTTVFGDGSGTSATVPGTGAGVSTASTVNVYGQLPDNVTNQAATPVNYSDTITVTVTY